MGLVVARETTGLIAELLHGTSPTDPGVYAAVALGVVAVSLVASWLPARRAARVEPALALRAP